MARAASNGRALRVQRPIRRARSVAFTGALLVASLVGCQREIGEDADGVLVTSLQRRFGVVVRFTGAADLPPCAEHMSGPATTCSLLEELTARETREIARALERPTVGRSPDPNALRRQALETLLWKSDAAARETAVSLFTLALEMEPSSPGRQNDLAAVLLLRGSLDERPVDWADALELADRAAESGLQEARFNRVLALELLTIESQARDEWTALRDTREPRLARFAEAAASRWHGETHESKPDASAVKRRGERLLGAWASARLDGRATAAVTILEEAATVAAAHAAASGDRMLLATIDSIRTAEAGGGDRSDHLARGLRAFEAARGDELYADCGPRLDLAEHELSLGATPFVGWAHVDQAVCAYYRRDLPAAMRHLNAALAVASADSRFPTLSGRAHWIRGLIRTLEGDFSRAEADLSLARAELGGAAEPAHAIYLQTLRAKALESGGRPSEAWKSRMDGLRGRSQVAVQRRLSMLEEAVQSLRARELSRAASWFIGEQVSIAERSLAKSSAEADFLAFALLQRAALRREEGAVEHARRDLVSAERVISGLAADSETRRRLDLELAAERALTDHAVAGEPLAALDRAIAFFQGDSDEADQAEILRLVRLRAKVLREKGSFTQAEADLRRALAELERQRRGLQANDQRARFDAQMRGAREDLLALLLDRGRTYDALELVETTSNRWWLESARGSGRPSARRATETIPPDTLVLRYAYLRGRLVIWLLRNDGIEQIQLPISERRLRLSARMCREHDLASQRAHRPFCDLIAAHLLPDRVAALPPGSRLVIVSDSVSQEVPFAALRLRPDAPYLVERLRLAFIPGLLRLVADAASDTPAGRALFVADPAFDVERHPGLQRLTGAREAAAAYARAYARPLLISGPGATRQAVLAALSDARLVHFEAHGLTKTGTPEVSGVVLARDEPATGNAGALTAADIPRDGLPRLRLAVLAACQTSPRPYEGTAQLAGLAPAFIAAGASEVVTAASDIDNAEAIRFFTAFHDCYSRGETGEECLRTSQLAFLRSADPVLSNPRAWAPYQVHVATWNSRPASVQSQ